MGKCLNGCLITFIVGLIVLGIAKTVIGTVYKHECSLQNMIPNYLLSSAWGPILFGGVFTIKGGQLDAYVFVGLGGALLDISWLICGTIWIYPTYATLNKDTYVPCQTVNGTTGPAGCTEGTCNDTLIRSAFAMVTIDWIYMALIVFGVLGFILYEVCKSYWEYRYCPRCLTCHICRN